MNLCLASWSLRACTLIEAVAIAKALHIQATDLGYFYGPALDIQALLAEPFEMA